MHRRQSVCPTPTGGDRVHDPYPDEGHSQRFEVGSVERHADGGDIVTLEFTGSVLAHGRPEDGKARVASSSCGCLTMLARPGPLPSGSCWSFELKWDGFRAIVSTEDGLRVRSRRWWNMTPVLPELRKLPTALLLDGELVAERDSGPRSRRNSISARRRAARYSARCVAGTR
jgi:ATP dependent DNA ligase domain